VKVMALETDEFLRRFLLHVVPRGFIRIRHFGLLANRVRGPRYLGAATCWGSHPPRTPHPNRPSPSCSGSRGSTSPAVRCAGKGWPLLSPRGPMTSP
jgi:hypothetical protein